MSELSGLAQRLGAIQYDAQGRLRHLLTLEGLRRETLLISILAGVSIHPGLRQPGRRQDAVVEVSLDPAVPTDPTS